MAKALIIDDIKFIYANLKNILNDSNIEVFDYIEDIDKTLNIYEKNETDIDVVFLSLATPTTDKFDSSIDIIKRLKAIDPYCRIVAIKPPETQQLLLKAMQAGATDFIEKPLRAENIQNVVRNLAL